MHGSVIRPACLDLPQTPRPISFPKIPTPVSCRLARRRPLERSANFGDRLVAIFVQLLESLLQRSKFSRAFRRPFPIDIESVGGRWTGRRSLRGRQRRSHRCVVTVGRHFCTPHKLESGWTGSGGIFRMVARWPFDSAPHSVLFGCPAGADLVAKEGRWWRTSYSYAPPFP
jgi:hypothetical protein